MTLRVFVGGEHLRFAGRVWRCGDSIELPADQLPEAAALVAAGFARPADAGTQAALWLHREALYWPLQ